MYIKEFACHGFRSLRDVQFTPSTGMNIVRGENAHGKTSLLEAILYIVTSKSHRTNAESDLVCHSEESFRLHARVERTDRTVEMDAYWWQGVKRFKVNGVAQTRISDILGKVNVVLFSPEDVALIRGTAGQRRRFLDMELSQLHTGYLNALQQYRQVLRQRNELLRAASPDGAMLDVWDEQLLTHGAVLVVERGRFVDQIAGLTQDAYAQIADGEELQVIYQPNVDNPDDFADILNKAREGDIRRKMTTRGPHRDDIDFVLSGKPARSFASQGQQKSATLALKLAELELVKGRTAEYPVLMLDEVLAELDAQRASRLLDAIPASVQCIMTTTELGQCRALSALTDCSHFLIQQGELSSVEA